MDDRASHDRNLHRPFAKRIKTGVVQNLVQPGVKRVPRRFRQFAPVPQRFLPLSFIPRAHRHIPILKFFVAARAALLTTAIAACAIPSRHATRIDPVEAPRYE
jgi:ABC-type antimicrobial peptide transport system permease subunit